MKIKNLISNSLLVLISTYLPLLSISFFDYYFLMKRDVAKKIKMDNLLNEDLPMKIDAINAGFLPAYLPAEVLKLNKTPEIYPIGSLPNTPTYLCNEGYGLIKFKTDRFGLRNLDSKWDKVNSGTNIFVLGDSFIEGACVDQKYTIPSSIEEYINFNTINLGSGSNGPYEYMAILELLIKPILKDSNNKNIVILNFFINDNLPVNQKKEKLLDKSKSIVKFTKNNGVQPTDSYLKSTKGFISSNYPKSKKERILKTEEMINQLTKVRFKDTSTYQILSLYPLRFRTKELFHSPIINKVYSESFNSVSLLSCKLTYPPSVVV